MTRGNGSRGVVDGIAYADCEEETKVAVMTASVDDEDADSNSDLPSMNGADPALDTGNLVALVQNAYLRLIVGDAMNAQRTLEHALASEGIGNFAGANLNSARLIKAMEPHGDALPMASGFPVDSDESAVRSIVVRTLGRFEITVNGVNPGSKRKPPYRPLGMLKVLIANGGCAVSESVVIDVLWPDLDGDHAHAARQVALHRLRKLLGSADSITVANGRMFLDEEQIWVDALALETLSRSRVAGGIRQKAETALELYQGTFLPQEMDAPWTVRMRECLRAKFVNIIAKAATELEEREHYSEAAALYERGLAVDDLDDVLRTGLVRNLKKAGSASLRS